MTRKEIREKYNKLLLPLGDSYTVITDDILKFAKEKMDFKNEERSLTILKMRSEKKPFKDIQEVVGLSISAVRTTCARANIRYRQHIQHSFSNEMQVADDTRFDINKRLLRDVINENDDERLENLLIGIITDMNLESVPKEKQKEHIKKYLNTVVERK